MVFALMRMIFLLTIHACTGESVCEYTGCTEARVLLFDKKKEQTVAVHCIYSESYILESTTRFCELEKHLLVQHGIVTNVILKKKKEKKRSRTWVFWFKACGSVLCL